MSLEDTPGRILATSRYAEDAFPRGHRSVWGSWYCKETSQWGFACCHATGREAVGCCPDFSTASETEALSSAAESGPIAQAAASAAAAAAEAEWRPREAFQTSEGFVAHAMRYFALCWKQFLHDGSLRAAVASGQVDSSAASVLLSEKAARGAAVSLEDFGQRLCRRSLPANLVSKLEEMCLCIGAREYAHANKVYMDIAIGAKKWQSETPVFVSFSMQRQDTEVKWTPDCGSHPVDDAGVREHVIVLRRLLTVAQAVRPNSDPSKNCG
mmetsp:Transcript_146881/g.258880  ORF Transcript_146881/g.258880 Transcript_146881/m.258880 type:complete len:269 (-) Transcript_146881:18-824(-)